MEMKIVCPSNMKRCSRVANALAEEFQVDCIDIQELPNLLETDLLIIVGGGPSSGEDKSGMEGYIKKLDGRKVKYVGLVTLDSNWRNTSVAEVQNIKAGQGLIKRILKEKDVQILAEHMCETQFYFFCIGHPNRKDINKTIEWLNGLMKTA